MTASPALAYPRTPPVTWKVNLPELHLEHGAPLKNVNIALSRCGEQGPIYLVLGGISATGNPAESGQGWWRELAGPGCALDTTQCQVLSCDFLGGGASTHPAALGEFVLTPLDQAHAILEALSRSGIERLAGVIGCSYGGCVALALGTLDHPLVPPRSLVLCAAHQVDPRTSGYRALQRAIVQLAHEHGVSAQGVDLARRLAMLGFRTREELEQRFDAPALVDDRGVVTAIEGYLDARGAQYARNVSAASFVCLSQSCDLINVDPRRIRTRLWLAGARNDQIVPFRHLEALARKARHVERFDAIESVYGHDAFLKETGQVGDLLRAFVEATS